MLIISFNQVFFKFKISDCVGRLHFFYIHVLYTDKKKTNFSLYIRKFRMDRLQSNIWLKASSSPHIWLNICAFPHILGSLPIRLCYRSHLNFLLYEGNFVFFVYSVHLRCKKVLILKSFLNFSFLIFRTFCNRVWQILTHENLQCGLNANYWPEWEHWEWVWRRGVECPGRRPQSWHSCPGPVKDATILKKVFFFLALLSVKTHIHRDGSSRKWFH